MYYPGNSFFFKQMFYPDYYVDFPWQDLPLDHDWTYLHVCESF